MTNPAEWDSSGLLRLARRVDPSGPQHDCNVGCSPNMCKGAVVTALFFFPTYDLLGQELDAFLAGHGPAYDRIIYVGDGANDYCPALHLRRFASSGWLFLAKHWLI